MYETSGALPPNSERLGPAFAQFYADTHNFAARYAGSFGDPSQSEEVSSTAYVNVWAEIAEGRLELPETLDTSRSKALTSYLFTTIRNNVIMDARKARVREAAAPKIIASSPNLYPSAEQEASLFAEEIMVLLGAALKTKEMQVLLLTAQGFKNRETAKALGIPEGTVRSHLSNVRSKLQSNPALNELAAEYGFRPKPKQAKKAG